MASPPPSHTFESSPLYTDLFTLLQPQRLPASSSSTLGEFLPQDLCTCSFCRETLHPGSRRMTSSFLLVLLHLLSEAFPILRFPPLSSCLALTITTCYMIYLFLLFIDLSTTKAKERFFLLLYLQYFLRSPTHSMYVLSFPSFLSVSHQK